MNFNKNNNPLEPTAEIRNLILSQKVLNLTAELVDWESKHQAVIQYAGGLENRNEALQKENETLLKDKEALQKELDSLREQHSVEVEDGEAEEPAEKKADEDELKEVSDVKNDQSE